MSNSVNLTSKEWCDLVFEGKNKEFGDALKAHLKGELSKTDASQLFKEIGNTYDKDGLSKAYRAVRDVRLELGKMLSGYVQAKADDNKKALDAIDKRAKQLVAPLGSYSFWRC